MTEPQIVSAELTWTGEGFASGLQVEIDASGRLGRIGPDLGEPTLRLAGQALLPGFVNAHSHAFQRGLRGAERFPEGSGDFWSWRDAMYELADSLDEAGFSRLTRKAFAEMRRAGITTVGEFHYLHHASDEADFRFDDLVLEAARAERIRLALLVAHYRAGGVGRELHGAQRRFRTESPAAYWRQMDRLAGRLAPATQSLGAVVHSLRSSPPEEAAEVFAEARRRGLVFHLHLEEQRREIEECRDAYGATPMGLLLAHLDDLRGLTAVHCTHSESAELAMLLERGGAVCVCPLTEANLGDGLPDLAPLLERGAAPSLGTDSNARISMLEEMRWLEYGQRLRLGRRGVARDGAGRVAPRLLQAATRAGAEALGVEAGALRSGLWADLTAVSLVAPSLVGAVADELAEHLVFGADSEVVTGTCVGGEWRWHRPLETS